jgi:hypothetical protein
MTRFIDILLLLLSNVAQYFFTDLSQIKFKSDSNFNRCQLERKYLEIRTLGFASDLVKAILSDRFSV